MALDLRGGASSGGGGASSNPYLYKATNYTDLVTTYPTATSGDLAYVYNSQGTAWLPFTLGGTYYPSGVYVFNGSNWVSDRNAIVNQLEDLLYMDRNDNVKNISTSTYTALNIDYILNFTVNSTLTLPIISTLESSKTYRIFTDNVTVIINSSGSDLIDDANTFEISGYTCITLRALNNKWRIGD